MEKKIGIDYRILLYVENFQFLIKLANKGLNGTSSLEHNSNNMQSTQFIENQMTFLYIKIMAQFYKIVIVYIFWIKQICLLFFEVILFLTEIVY